VVVGVSRVVVESPRRPPRARASHPEREGQVRLAVVACALLLAGCSEAALWSDDFTKHECAHQSHWSIYGVSAIGTAVMYAIQEIKYQKCLADVTVAAEESK
jgi:hypothetical protein